MSSSSEHFPLHCIPEHLLPMVVKMFTLSTGAKVYRSCKGAKAYIDQVKPRWILENSRFLFKEGMMSLDVVASPTNGFDMVAKKYFPSQLTPALDFVRIHAAAVGECDPDHFANYVLPQLESHKGMKSLNFYDSIPIDQMTRAIDAAKPKCISVVDQPKIDLKHSCLQNAKYLVVTVPEYSAESYLKDSALKVFTLGMNRQELCIAYFRRQYAELVEKFIMAWMRGQSVGSMKKFTLSVRNPTSELQLFINHVERIVKENKKEFVRKHRKMSNGKYRFQRSTSERMEVKITAGLYVFHFF